MSCFRRGDNLERSSFEAHFNVCTVKCLCLFGTVAATTHDHYSDLFQTSVFITVDVVMLCWIPRLHIEMQVRDNLYSYHHYYYYDCANHWTSFSSGITSNYRWNEDILLKENIHITAAKLNKAAWFCCKRPNPQTQYKRNKYRQIYANWSEAAHLPKCITTFCI